MADSGTGIVLLDTDPHHAMKTPFTEIELSPFIKGDQSDHKLYKLSEKPHKLGSCLKLLTTKSDLTQIST